MQHFQPPTSMRPTLSLTSKIVLLVCAMGAAFAMIAAYASWQIRSAEQHHHELLHTQTLIEHDVGALQHTLGEAATLVHAALTIQPAAHSQTARERLEQMRLSFAQQLQDIGSHAVYSDVPDFARIRPDSERFFQLGSQVIDARLQGHTELALRMLSDDLTPVLEQIQQDVGILHRQIHAFFKDASLALITQTQHTLRHTYYAGWISLLLISALAAWLAWRDITRPLQQLTRSMQHMSEQQYDTPIAGQERHDEIGTMARTLQSLAAALQEAQRLQQELQQQQQKNLLTEHLQNLTSALPGAVFQIQRTTEGQWQLRFISPQWAQLIGLDADCDTSLATASRYLRQHDPNAVARAMQHFMESARTMQPLDFDVPMEMLDGATRWIKTRANPHLEPDGSIVFNGVWLDVTREVMQAQALSKAKRQAEQSASARTAMQAMISHEIRTPLNAILGLTQLLLKTDLPQPQREQLHSVLRAGQHLRGIINEVLDFSKIDAGQLKLESTDFSLQTVVQDVLRMCDEDACHKGLMLHYEIAPDVPDGLRGDPHRIAQILLNYVNNAIKFTESGQIDIRIRLGSGSSLHRIVLHASVRDTGPGVPADHIPMLFEAFQQADNSITRRYGGTGLGLAICRSLAQLMGGTVGVQSTVGTGSTFWFTAVLEPARSIVRRPAAETPQRPVPPPPAWQNQCVLVVDDNALNRAVVEGMLHAMGIRTDMAEDGAQALHKLQAGGPDRYGCVLMDIQMPNMDGISATRALRQMPGFAQLPVIAMTAHASVQDMERNLEAGMNAHLSKPLLESALREVLQQWLGTHPRPASAASDDMPAPATQPPVFDPSAIDALAQMFDHAKLQQLVTQFATDTWQRAQQLGTLAHQQDWQGMRAETHKLSGTAATFGLLRLDALALALSAALKRGDAAQIGTLCTQVHAAAYDGIRALQAYCPP